MKKVLVVDDSLEVIQNLRKLVEKIDGLTLVGSADNVNAAVTLFSSNKPDIIILDIGLTKGSGIEVLHQIKSLPAPATVIMFTNYSKDAFRKTSIKLGADYFLDKTHDFDRLIDILKEIAEK
ncbi:MAG: response regulator transcription factor [Ignavibacteriales bacterium]|nr:response regulator transcription factor [Ignavibacteriales bacterium]